MSSIVQIVSVHNIAVQKYANITQLFISLSTATLPAALAQLEHRIADLNS